MQMRPNRYRRWARRARSLVSTAFAARRGSPQSVPPSQGDDSSQSLASPQSWRSSPSRSLADRIHRPHVESWDTRTGLHVNRAGATTPLLEYEVRDGVLTALRRLNGHHKIARMRSWLLPMAGLRVIRWTPHPGRAWEDEDYYVDIASITVEGSRWRFVDHYLDLLVYTGDRVEVVDLDEFIAAVGAGYLDPATAERALETSHRALAGITACGHDLEAWLKEAYGVRLF